ncbi:G-protein-signaling modulator 1 [Hippoglossus hippoglossus]|uniref:G-protein-signaling modulator 1 n=1 Tax=Hippoglossus hippoglossus TaxID=8267 RepID=UPI00148DD519|nr:G-protein-signaling modulator 1 [Hippoglossus hippoglossus]XP_034450893.1 G-protein-signaling modulator 1 [Hippoglossus hippoglossus]
MADKQPAPSTSSPPHQNGKIGEKVPKRSSPSHQNGHLDRGRRRQTPGTMSPVLQPPSASSTPASTSPVRCLVSPVPGPGPEGRSSSSRPRTQSPASALTSRTRTCAPHIQRRSSQQEEPEALLNLILESQGQRLDDQRANVGLLPDPGPAPLCGACRHEQRPLPTVDFYYMLINFQSDRMEDQRCPLPDLDDLVGSAPEGQEDFFSLIQRVQSRRMDEQRVSLMTSHTEDEDDSSPHRHHH